MFTGDGMTTTAATTACERDGRPRSHEHQLEKQVAALKDPALSDLYFLPARRGRWEALGPRLRTAPHSHDPNEVRLHLAMLRLEAAGLARRAEDGEVSITWEAAGAEK